MVISVELRLASETVNKTACITLQRQQALVEKAAKIMQQFPLR